MNSNKYIHTKSATSTNLIGDSNHRNYLITQAAYGFAQRGGVQFPYISSSHATRLVSDVNILTSKENKHLIFSESIFSN
jgi:hypothetical protein